MPKIRYGASQRKFRQSRRGYLKPRYPTSQMYTTRPPQIPTIRPTVLRLPNRNPNVRTGGFLDRELKFFDTTYPSALVTTQGWTGSEHETATYGLFCPQQGDGASGRDGRRCLIKSVHLKGFISRRDESDQDDPAPPLLVTFMVVLDTQTNGAQAQGETIMSETPAADGRSISFRNLEYTNRFKIIFKRTFVVRDTMCIPDGANTGSTTGTGFYFAVNKRMNIPVEFSASTGNITDIVDNSIHVYCCCNAANAAYLKYNSRVRFVG